MSTTASRRPQNSGPMVKVGLLGLSAAWTTLMMSRSLRSPFCALTATRRDAPKTATSGRGGTAAASHVRRSCWAAAVVTASSSRAQAQAQSRS